MNEIYELKMKCHYYDHCLTETKLKELENGHTINVLEVKLVFLEKKTQICVRSLKIKKNCFYKPIIACLNLFVTLHCFSFRILPPQKERNQLVYTK